MIQSKKTKGSGEGRMKIPRLDIRVVGVSLFVVLVLGGKLWMDYTERTAPAEVSEILRDGVGGEFTISSAILGEERTVVVHLPRRYNDSEEAFPVLYVLDAEMASVLMGAVSTVGSLHVAGVSPDMIVVGVCNVNRNRDTIPVSVAQRPGSGGAQNFLRFLNDELIPLIEGTYRATRPRVLYGESNAGLFAVYAMLERPNSFDAYIASSPTIGWCPEHIHGLAEERFAEALQDKFLFMIYGSQDNTRVTEYLPGFVELIRAKAPECLRWESRLLDGEGHVPASSLEEGLRALFHQ
jgi:predicted alpha/beta superfamily hydrolase